MQYRCSVRTNYKRTCSITITNRVTFSIKYKHIFVVTCLWFSLLTLPFVLGISVFLGGQIIQFISFPSVLISFIHVTPILGAARLVLAKLRATEQNSMASYISMLPRHARWPRYMCIRNGHLQSGVWLDQLSRTT